MHSLGVRIGKSQDELRGTPRYCAGARLFYPILGQGGKRTRQADAVDEVIVLERTFRIVLNGSNIDPLFANEVSEKMFNGHVYGVVGAHLTYFCLELRSEQIMDKVQPFLVSGVIVRHDVAEEWAR